MQLQGELKSRGTYRIHYRNVFHAFYTIGRVEGVSALQKGLVPGLLYQFSMNGVRLGSYAIIESAGYIHTEGRVSTVRSIAAGAVSGVVGAFVGSPIYLVSAGTRSRALGFPTLRVTILPSVTDSELKCACAGLLGVAAHIL